MNTHKRVDDLLSGFALGTVSEDDARTVRNHVATCNICARALDELTESVAVLPLSVDEVVPPASLRQRVLQGALEVREEAPAHGHRDPWVIPLRRPWFHAPQALGWAAAAVLVIGVGAWNVTLQGQVSRANAQLAQVNHQVIHANMLGAHGSIAGTISYLSADRIALVSLRDLSAPPTGKTYELWVIDASGKADPAGVFLPESDGSKFLVVPRALGVTDRIAATVEPVGGSRQPTSSPFIIGNI